MSSTFLKVEMIGNLGRDPEMKYTPSGQPVTTFSAAATRTWNNAAGEKQEETTWVRVNAWGKLAENCHQYLHKGSTVYIEGRLIPGKDGSPRIWTKQDGTSAASFELNADVVRFLDKKNGSGAPSEGAPVEEGSHEPANEIPF